VILDWLASAWATVNNVPAKDWPWIVGVAVVVLYLARGKKKRR
jgi:hypothetical protein